MKLLALLFMSSLLVLGSRTAASPATDEVCRGVQTINDEEAKIKVVLSDANKTALVVLEDSLGFSLNLVSELSPVPEGQPITLVGTDKKWDARIVAELGKSSHSKRSFKAKLDYEGDYIYFDAVLSCKK